MASPCAPLNQRTFAYPQPMPSPLVGTHAQPVLAYGTGGKSYAFPYPPPGRQLRGRPADVSSAPHRPSAGGILPTPDPTVGSAISDEDVAMQLIRLGDPLAFSVGRTSNSTLDDAMSGKADAASSDEGEDGDDQTRENRHTYPVAHSSRLSSGGHARKRQRVDGNLVRGNYGGQEHEHRALALKESGSAAHRSERLSTISSGTAFNARGAATKAKGRTGSKTPMSPASLPASSRKASLASTSQLQSPIGPDEDDLSSKPRCQRCRKSKKGCDRQRPCGRCKDAGVGIDGCVSEDENNGRKGRFGRHMGVAVKKCDTSAEDGEKMMAQATVPGSDHGLFLAPPPPDKSKKRKR